MRFNCGTLKITPVMDDDCAITRYEFDDVDLHDGCVHERGILEKVKPGEWKFSETDYNVDKMILREYTLFTYSSAVLSELEDVMGRVIRYLCAGEVVRNVAHLDSYSLKTTYDT